MFATVNPATGEKLAQYDYLTDEQLQDALARTDAAHRSWREVPLDERIAVLHRVADLYRERRDELARLTGLEMGKPFEEAKGEIDIVASIWDYYADHAEDLLREQELSVSGGGRAFIRTKSIGSILGIMPWNYPHYQVARFAAPNLVLGNSVLLKHAENCPQNALVVQELVEQAGGLPDAYLNVFVTTEQVGTILADRRNQGVSLTGSERAGAAVAEIAGRNLKKCVLELGGSDAFILLDTDDMDLAVEKAASGRMYNSGQACNSPKRLIVVEDLYEDFVSGLKQRLTSLRADPDTEMAAVSIGPVASRTAAEQLQEQVDDAVSKGATLHLGGTMSENGSFFSPTLLTDVKPGMRAYREEVFGPVAVVYKVKDEAAAIELANDSDYGLSCDIFSASPERAIAVADQLETGMAWINGISGTQADLPFGGVKKSGYGRELGEYGILEFANKKIFRLPAE
ncbi:succinate-semialdehyde dehydrogenase/glutarate-semialdehyde dehydrogenase [Nakamurella flavida]|nr:NAD-dependent succinate-semialdehyde dehydrogenase [Nakamurella flavida]MDP9778581.1 succinate-semialdehyde dehydrogenase/glutarate-semialdehyde dehydrogenase [Nakamurella flavida]